MLTLAMTTATETYIMWQHNQEYLSRWIRITAKILVVYVQPIQRIS
jgi:hypothetical protein